MSITAEEKLARCIQVEEDLIEAFGRVIELEIQSRGLRHSQLAEKMGVNRSTVTKLCAGRGSMSLYAKAYAVLGIQVSLLRPTKS